MIAQLTGTVTAAGATWVVLDVGGVGFRALCTPAVAASVRPGEPATVATSLVVRQDSLTLYAFADADERDLFELVQSASGVGPKIAQAVVSVLPPAEFAAAIAAENVVALTKVPGIGKKGAERIALELRDKIAAPSAAGGVAPPTAAATADAGREPVREALVGLGWTAKQADAAIEKVVAHDADPSVPALLKAALRELGR